ncbi:hypothetical protein [Ruegeria sp. HKCCD4332]|uniref:hypothetical protein n=1 Tax=Ruegeria sp. HKCCD4332 TaxID=2683021 RepID=UPI001492CD7E|nr:hypothetical protein [Ruegeria sp. HKCCD4332]NOD76206.1 hypothetical protein [Ruegeria sp. HKCCD4332]
MTPEFSKSPFLYWIKQMLVQTTAALYARLAIPFLSLLALPVVLLADVEKPENFGKLSVKFEYEGKPANGSLIVSNGTSRQEWVDVSEIFAEVPSSATYIFDLKPPDDDQTIPITFRDVIPILEIPDSGSLDLIVSVLPSDLPKPFDPVIFIREAGVDVTVSNRAEEVSSKPNRLKLTSRIEKSKPSLVLLDGIYSTEETDPDDERDFTCGDNCPHLFQDLNCDPMCYTCSSTCVSRGYWKANYNMCEGILTSEPPESEWEELPPGIGGLQLAVATINDGAIYPNKMELSGAGYTEVMEPPFKTRSFPDFTAPEGDYLYSLSFDNAGIDETAGTSNVTLPLSIRDGRIGNLIVRLPVSRDELQAPFPIADNRIGAVLRAYEFSPAGRSISLDVTSPDPDPGAIWYALALPQGLAEDEVKVTSNGYPVEHKSRYVFGVVTDQPVLIVRSEGQRDEIRITW